MDTRSVRGAWAPRSPGLSGPRGEAQGGFCGTPTSFPWAPQVVQTGSEGSVPFSSSVVGWTMVPKHSGPNPHNLYVTFYSKRDPADGVKSRIRSWGEPGSPRWARSESRILMREMVTDLSAG